MTEQQLSALLGRPLTANEMANLDLYLDIAQETLETLLCMSLDVQAEDETPTTRTFIGREGYSTTFTGIFTDVTNVTVDGKAEEYYPALWDDRNASYYNSIVLTDHVHDGHCEMAITAKWGFPTLPNDLARLMAQQFAMASSRAAIGGKVKRKSVEDFSIEYADVDPAQNFLDMNAATIRKYSMCNIGYIRHGKVC